MELRPGVFDVRQLEIFDVFSYRSWESVEWQIRDNVNQLPR